MKARIIAELLSIWKWLQSVVIKTIKGMLEKPIKSAVTTIVIVLTGWGATAAVNSVITTMERVNTYVVDTAMRRQLTDVQGKLVEITEQNKQLRGDLQSAQAQNIYDKKKFVQEFNLYKKSMSGDLRAIADSLEAANKKIVSLEQGHGSVTISNSGNSDKRGHFVDDWIDVWAAPLVDSNGYNFNYHFNFDVNDRSIRYAGKDGDQNEIYSVYLQSQRDTSKRIPIGNFKKSLINNSEIPIIPEKPQSLSINGDIAYGGHGLEGAVSISFWTINSGATEKNVIFRLPEIGISSNFAGSMNLFGGIRFNLAHYLPLFQNLYTSVKYGYNVGYNGKNLMLGLGATF